MKCLKNLLCMMLVLVSSHSILYVSDQEKNTLEMVSYASASLNEEIIPNINVRNKINCCGCIITMQNLSNVNQPNVENCIINGPPKCCGPFVAVAMITTLVCGFAFGYAPCKYDVYNREDHNLDVSYRSGGSKTITRIVEPNNHLEILSAGRLITLCASNNFISLKTKCTTDKGLSRGSNRNWYVHDGLSFTRGTGSSAMNMNTTVAASWNGTNLDYVSDVAPKLITHSLRGSNKK